ncbi:MAG: HAMP domain-containing protein [Deltaproteobacteria bacterium]|nr:HAMP domain-containing protein [Deltaproteobacteria bacterium]
MKTSGVRFGIRTKLIVSFGFIIVLLMLVSASAYLSLLQVDGKFNQLLGTYGELDRLTRETENARLRLQSLEKDLALQFALQGIGAAFKAGDDARATVATMRDNLAAISKLNVDRTLQRTSAELLKLLDAYEEYLTQLETSLKESSSGENTAESRLRSAEAAIANLSAEGPGNAVQTLRPVLAQFAADARAKSDQALLQMEHRSRTTRLIIMGITACAVVLALIFTARLSGGIIKQARHIMRLLEKIGVGEYRARTPVTSNDELGAMAGSLNKMLDNIVVLIQTREERDRMQTAIMKLLEDVSRFADGDLSREAEVTEEFTGAIADAFNMTIAQLREIIRRVQDSTNRVSSSAHKIYKTAEQIAHGNESGAMGVSTITAAIDEMAASIQAVSDNAAQSADVATKSLEGAQKGARAVQATIEGMGRIRERVQETAKRIKRLGESSQEIGEIVQVINDLADRTSILALNASIQAAMAGEQGRGFAVVAEEVERLAQRSARATGQIGGLISAIQGETHETVVAMEETTREVVAGSRLSQDAGKALSQIESISNQLAELIQSISLSSRQQARAADDISISMNQISEITQQTADGTKQAAASIHELATLADELRGSVSTFKLPEAETDFAAGIRQG